MKKDGTLIATDCRYMADGGAYLSVAALNLYLFGLFTTLPFSVPNVTAVGDSINLQPPNVFSTPIKLVMPTPGQTNVSNLVIYFYNGVEWVLGCDASGNSDWVLWYTVDNSARCCRI